MNEDDEIMQGGADDENIEEDILDILLDPDNKDPIIMRDDKGRQVEFEQVAVVPLNDRIYCVLKPITHIAGIAEDEALVFYVDEKEGEEPVLVAEMDEMVSIQVFEEYYKLLEEEVKKDDDED